MGELTADEGLGVGHEESWSAADARGERRDRHRGERLPSTELSRHIASMESPIALDLRGVTFIDSSGLSVLVTIARTTSLKICGASDGARRVIELPALLISSSSRRERTRFAPSRSRLRSRAPAGTSPGRGADRRLGSRRDTRTSAPSAALSCCERGPAYSPSLHGHSAADCVRARIDVIDLVPDQLPLMAPSSGTGADILDPAAPGAAAPIAAVARRWGAFHCGPDQIGLGGVGSVRRRPAPTDAVLVDNRPPAESVTARTVTCDLPVRAATESGVQLEEAVRHIQLERRARAPWLAPLTSRSSSRAA